MKPISRHIDDGIVIYNADADPITTVPVPADTEGYAVAPGLDRVAVVTPSAVLCLTRDGSELWRFPAGSSRNAFGVCAFTPRLVWAYLPTGALPADDDLASDEVLPAGDDPAAFPTSDDLDDEEDRWVGLDIETGELRIEHRLGTAGLGGKIVTLETAGELLLEVGEGDDGVTLLRTARDGSLHAYPWDSQVLIAAAPDEQSFMAITQDQEDLAFFTYPAGEMITAYLIDEFGYEGGQGTYFEWSGGYLDGETAIVVAGGADGESGAEWWRHFRLDIADGEITDLPVATMDPYDLEPRGDGTYLVTDTDGTLRRL